MRLAITVLACTLVATACKTMDPGCQKQMEECLARCERSGIDDSPTHPDEQERTTTYCEDRCQKCREPSAPAPAPSNGPPTPTGNAQ